MVDFRKLVRENFDCIVRRFNFNLVSVSYDDLLLVGRSEPKFALEILRDFDFVRINYIRGVDHQDFSCFPITGTVVERRFTADDRLLYGKPVGLSETLNASLRVYASGLESTCIDILSGSVDWLNLLRSKDRATWSGCPVTLDVKEALHSSK